ncbi:MAG TPA: hypothetical protein VI078_13655 [bacterium]
MDYTGAVNPWHDDPSEHEAVVPDFSWLRERYGKRAAKEAKDDKSTQDNGRE